MKLINAYKLAVKLLKRQAKDNPGKTFTSPDGEKMTISDVANKLGMVSKWVYPGLDSDDITCVVRCKKCIYYKKYRNNKGIKSQTFRACSKGMSRRSEDFFCKDGIRNDL